MTPLIDVVIPTRDRPEALVACLEALAQQTIEDVHVIVMDDGSHVPATDIVPAELRARLDLTMLRHATSRGPAAARNGAIQRGDAPYVAFVDDDVRCAPDLLERHLEAIRTAGDRQVIIGPLSAPPDWDPTPWNLWEALQVQAEYVRMAEGEYTPTWRQFHTGNAFLARETIEEAGLFDERFTRAEDVEFALRMAVLGHQFLFNAGAVGWHYSHRTLDAWLRIPRAYADFDVLLDRMYPRLHWLDTVQRERRQRHPFLRAARGLSRIPHARPRIVSALTSAATSLHQGHVRRRIPMALLSIAYDLEYGAAQARAAADGRVGASDSADDASIERVQLP